MPIALEENEGLLHIDRALGSLFVAAVHGFQDQDFGLLTHVGNIRMASPYIFWKSMILSNMAQGLGLRVLE